MLFVFRTRPPPVGHFRGAPAGGSRCNEADPLKADGTEVRNPVGFAYSCSGSIFIFCLNPAASCSEPGYREEKS